VINERGRDPEALPRPRGSAEALSCKLLGAEEKRMLAKLVFSGGKLNFKLKTGASIPACAP